MAVDVEMVIPPGDPSEPCYESETIELLKEAATRAERGDKNWLLQHARVMNSFRGGEPGKCGKQLRN